MVLLNETLKIQFRAEGSGSGSWISQWPSFD